MKNNYDETSAKSIIKFAKRLQNKRLIDFVSDKKIITIHGKGQFGQYLEKYYFGYDLNNKKGVDFEKAQLELKTGGVIFRKGLLVSKERLSIGLINFSDLINEDFYSSTLWKKLKNTLLIYYEYKTNSNPLKFRIRVVGIHQFSKNDISQIKRDWEIIKNKVLNGEAHLISSGDTDFLEASTTGTKNQKLTSQPNNVLKAKPRRFALKPTYMSSILNQMYFENILIEEKNMEILENLTKNLQFFQGKSYNQISSTLFLDISSSNKARYATISQSLVNHCLSNIDSTAQEQWKKYNYKIKAVRVSKNRNVKESLSFSAFDPIKLIEETWETSNLHRYLEEYKYLFIFWRQEGDEYILDKISFWNMPAVDILEAKKVWEKTRECLKNNKLNEFPKMKENKVCHVRPKAKNKKDTVKTHLGSDMGKKAFWINGTYIRDNIYNS